MAGARDPRKVTMQDVADEAGVSIATVSFVINGKKTTKVSEATRERVQRAADALGYRPNAVAKTLRIGASSFIGLVSDSIATTPFAGQIVRGAQDAAWAHGFVLLVANTEGDPDVESNAISMMLEHRVRGILYSTWYHRDVVPPDGLREAPSVLVNCYDQAASMPAVVPDEVAGGFTATQTLIEAGHSRIAFVNATEPAPATVGRLQGYRDAMTSAGLTPADDWLVYVPPEQEGGYEAARHLLSMNVLPTAVFCYNDRVAMGLYVALAKAGLRVPDDISVIGYDNQEVISAHLDPPLTTVQLPHYELGYEGIQQLLSSPRESRSRKHTPVVLPCPLVPRSSIRSRVGISDQALQRSPARRRSSR